MYNWFHVHMAVHISLEKSLDEQSTSISTGFFSEWWNFRWVFNSSYTLQNDSGFKIMSIYYLSIQKKKRKNLGGKFPFYDSVLRHPHILGFSQASLSENSGSSDPRLSLSLSPSLNLCTSSLPSSGIRRIVPWLHQVESRHCRKGCWEPGDVPPFFWAPASPLWNENR